MSNIWLYAAIAALTIASPGPGVLLTLTNTLNYRASRALYGIAGGAAGMAIIGLIASSSLGIVLVASPHALRVVKVIGAAYLLYLGTKVFRSKPRPLDGAKSVSQPSGQRLFTQAFFITLFNPKPIVFFMALFPQFIDPHRPVTVQLATLSVIFCTLFFAVHCMYACFAVIVSSKLSGDNFSVILNRVAGSVFIIFGSLLALSVFH